jgi:hypothetical protein
MVVMVVVVVVVVMMIYLHSLPVVLCKIQGVLMDLSSVDDLNQRLTPDHTVLSEWFLVLPIQIKSVLAQFVQRRAPANQQKGKMTRGQKRRAGRVVEESIIR